MKNNENSNRRGFLKIFATIASGIGISATLKPGELKADGFHAEGTGSGKSPADLWFNNIKGKHRIVFDVPHPHSIFPFAWPRVFLNTNESTGTPAQKNSVVVVLRHNAICYAFEDRIWAKYNLGEHFKADDPATKKPAIRNPFWKPEKGAYKIPGIGEMEIGINELQEQGVMFCVCKTAITVNSNRVAAAMGIDVAEIQKDWESGLLSGIQQVPSGVWALGRAQEHGCGYIFAG